jgi:hypothetical protein
MGIASAYVSGVVIEDLSDPSTDRRVHGCRACIVGYDDGSRMAEIIITGEVLWVSQHYLFIDPECEREFSESALLYSLPYRAVKRTHVGSSKIRVKKGRRLWL